MDPFFSASWLSLRLNKISPIPPPLLPPCLSPLPPSFYLYPPVAPPLSPTPCLWVKMERLNLGPTGAGSIKVDPDADVLYGLTIGEGTETVLAGRMLGYRPAWVTGGKGTIKHFPVLPEPVQSLSVHWEPDADADVRVPRSMA